MDSKAEEVKEDEVLTHESGLNYRIIEVFYPEENNRKAKLRLFDSDKAYRHDFEEYDEFKVRSKVNQAITKRKLQGKLVWRSSQWGPLTPETASKLMKYIEEYGGN